MVIDIHVHPIPGDDPQAPARVAGIAARAGVDRLVLLGVVGPQGPYPSPEQCREANDVTLAWMRARPDVYLGFCYLNPAHDPEFLRDEAERCCAEGMCGIKLWIAVKTTDPRLDAVMDIARRHRVPVLQHSWYKTTMAYPDESTPAEVAELGRRHPDVPLIMAHLTGCGQRGVADIQDVPNILIDTSGSQPTAGIIEYAVRELGEHRVVYGSDGCGRDFSVAVARVRGADLTPRQRRLVLGGNAARLLRLQEVER